MSYFDELPLLFQTALAAFSFFRRYYPSDHIFFHVVPKTRDVYVSLDHPKVPGGGVSIRVGERSWSIPETQKRWIEVGEAWNARKISDAEMTRFMIQPPIAAEFLRCRKELERLGVELKVMPKTSPPVSEMEAVLNVAKGRPGRDGEWS